MLSKKRNTLQQLSKWSPDRPVNFRRAIQIPMKILGIKRGKTRWQERQREGKTLFELGLGINFK